jgi:Predicted HD-superfamily hydrolase
MSEQQVQPPNIPALKERALELFRSTGKENIEGLIDYLENRTDYFSAPASTQFHGAYTGGLVDHSLAVYDNLVKMVELFEIQAKPESLIIIALLHDLCKTNFYKTGYRNRKNETTGQWEKVEVYEIDDKMPLGHSEKSIIIIQQFIKLTKEETLAIRWHMGAFDDAVQGSYGGMKALSNAYHMCPLAAATHMADMATSYFDGK